MSEEKRNRKVRMNNQDIKMLKAAKSELDGNPPMGLVARLGAKELLNEEKNEVTF